MLCGYQACQGTQLSRKIKNAPYQSIDKDKPAGYSGSEMNLGEPNQTAEYVGFFATGPSQFPPGEVSCKV